MNPLLTLILPAYNEQDRLDECIHKVADFIEKQPFETEVIIVENGSHDDTLRIAQEYAGQYAWLKVVSNDLPGKGRAVRRGMLEACGQYRFFADVDFSMPVDEILHFLPPENDQYDVAIGSREAKGAVRFNEPAFRHFTGRIFNWVVRLLAVHSIQDTQCGFKCFTAKAAQDLFSVQVLDGWAFDAEVLFIAQRFGYRIIEVPVNWYYDDHSKISVFSDSLKMLKELLQIRKNYNAGLYNKLKK